MPHYIILFVPNTVDASIGLHEVERFQTYADNISDAITKFIKESMDENIERYRDFLVQITHDNTLFKSSDNDETYDEFHKVQHDLNIMANNDDIYSYDESDIEVFDFIQNHFDEFHYLLMNQDGQFFEVIEIEEPTITKSAHGY